MKIANCPEREQIAQYLNGWTDETTAIEFEQHLSTCRDCEQTLALVDVETKAELFSGNLAPVLLANDTFDSHQPNDSTENQTTEELPAEIRQAVADIRHWNHDNNRSPETNEQPAADGHERNRVHFGAGSTTGDFGNYELLELVGKGGMAEVYRARHKRLKREVALKMIRVPRWHLAESLGRIEREMQAVGRLNHPAIVTALDAGEHHGIQFLVTEFIDGLDVGRIARAAGPLSIADACELVRVAALGLDHAHAHGIVHRDIKPSNVMIDRTGRVKILDFGLVHLDGWAGVSVEMTSVGQLLGTLDYMAPEQADRPDQVSPRSDAYSLGATLFRLLCGRAPYAASSNQSPLEKLRLLANARPPRVATLRPDLPLPLAELIDRTLARNPDDRPPSAAHLAEALQPFSTGADLAGLVERALGAPQDSTLLLDRGDSLAPSLASLVSRADSPQLKLKTRGAGRSRRIWQSLVGLALLLGVFAMAYLGIVLILDTQKGQIVIETDVPNLQVELLAGGEVRQEIELVPGENSTRIYAGEYEIRINDGTDRYVLDQNTFVLKRGEKVVARVTVNSADRRANIAWNETAENQSPTVANLPSPAQPTYDGKTIEHWLSVLKLERNGTRIQEAAGAVYALCRDDVETTSRCRQFVMEPILAGNPAEWTFYIVNKVGLSDDDYVTVESMLMQGSIGNTQQLVSLLATDAAIQGQKNRLAKARRFQKTLLSLESRPELFSGIAGIDLATRSILQVAQGNSSSQEFVQEFLASVLEAKHLGPRIIVGLKDSNRNQFESLIGSGTPLKLLFVAAFRAIEQYGIEDPEFLQWTSILNVLQAHAPVDLINQLPRLLDETLLACSASEITLQKQGLLSTNTARGGQLRDLVDLEILKKPSIGRMVLRFNEREADIVRARGEAGGLRLASPALDLLLIRASLSSPLDESARKSIEAVRAATANESQQLMELLKAESIRLGNGEIVGEPKGIVVALPFEFRPAREDAAMEVIASWSETGDMLGIEQVFSEAQLKQYEAMAMSLFSNYNKNQNGSLDKKEVAAMRRPPPINADRNEDGLITLSELTFSLSGGATNVNESRNPKVETPTKIQASAKLVIAAIIHEQASLMLQAQPDNDDSTTAQQGEPPSDPQSSPNPPPSTDKNPAAKND